MQILVWILSNKRTHIFLCHTMAQKFSKLYDKAATNLVISNSAFVDPVLTPVKQYRNEDVLKIGFSAEKIILLSLTFPCKFLKSDNLKVSEG